MESGEATLAECRICQEEDDKGNMEIPCVCSGTLKYAHRKCLERWSHKKGDSICELCYQQYKVRTVDQMPRGNPDIQMKQKYKPTMIDQMLRGDQDGAGVFGGAKVSMIQWKEREHEAVEMAALHDPGTIQALRNCGLLKFFRTHNMRRQTRLLDRLVHMWDPNLQVFQCGTQTLEIEIEDIYFITGLSKRGAPVVMSGQRSDVELTMDDYIREYCLPGTEKKSGRASISAVMDLPLRTILFCITRAFGSLGAHSATKAQMTYALECLEPRVFNWCEGLRTNLHSQLTCCRTGKQSQFGYGSILVAFFLERVPLLQPQIVLPVRVPTEPRLVLWSSLAERLRGVQTLRFDASFLGWLDRQMMMTEDFPYAGMDFRGDPELVLPLGANWDETDVGLVRPVGMPPFQRRVEAFGGGDEALQSHLEHLTARVPGAKMNDIPLDLQVYTVGVSKRMRRVLQRVACAVLYYHEHHLEDDDDLE